MNTQPSEVAVEITSRLDPDWWRIEAKTTYAQLADTLLDFGMEPSDVHTFLNKAYLTASFELGHFNLTEFQDKINALPCID